MFCFLHFHAGVVLQYIRKHAFMIGIEMLDDLRFSGDALLTDIATITPLLAARPPDELGS